MKIYNTLTRKKEEFTPLDDNTVRMYVCGPTVYNYIHIGNARSAVAFDTIRRYLEFKGYNVIYVSNYTDVDDKMIKRANEMGISVAEVAKKFIAEYERDADLLNLKRPTYIPRATEVIPEIIDMIKRIKKAGYAYVTEDGVYFDVRKKKDYGKLSKIDRESLKAGARVEKDEKKKNPEDFALWKFKKPGEPYWDSPWGEGRPGWHAECSVMSYKYLGPVFDIHGGGQDLIFPHHENEIAQSEIAYGVDQHVRFWLHNGFVTMDKVKMSKSLGNIVRARQVLTEFDPEAVRLFLSSTHYRQPIDFTEEQIRQWETNLERIYETIKVIDERIEYLLNNEPQSENEHDKILIEELEKMKKEFIEAMDDDFNSPKAFAVLFPMTKTVRKQAPEANSSWILHTVKYELMRHFEVFGLGFRRITTTKKVSKGDKTTELVEKILELREQARKSKDYKTADAIRDMLKDVGITVSDTPDGPKWDFS